MATKGEIMRGGMPAEIAQLLGFDYATGLSGAGTTQADATVLTANMNVFTTVGSSTGALLPSATGTAPAVIYNGGSNALTVYPTGTQTINNGATSFSVTNAKAAVFFPHGNTWIAILSA
jgi:hypothetical protein